MQSAINGKGGKMTDVEKIQQAITKALNDAGYLVDLRVSQDMRNKLIEFEGRAHETA